MCCTHPALTAAHVSICIYTYMYIHTYIHTCSWCPYTLMGMHTLRVTYTRCASRGWSQGVSSYVGSYAGRAGLRHCSAGLIMLYACVCVCVCVCDCINIFTCVCVCARARARPLLIRCKCRAGPICVYACTQASVHTYKHYFTLSLSLSHTQRLERAICIEEGRPLPDPSVNPTSASSFSSNASGSAPNAEPTTKPALIAELAKKGVTVKGSVSVSVLQVSYLVCVCVCVCVCVWLLIHRIRVSTLRVGHALDLSKPFPSFMWIQSHPLLWNNTHMLVMIRSQGMYALFKEDAHGGVNATAQASSGTGRARAVPYRPLRAGTAPSSVKVMCFGVASTLFGPEHSGRFARICMHVYVYMYVCVCVCVYIHVFTCIYIYIYSCICLYICLFVCVCVYIYNMFWRSFNAVGHEYSSRLVCMHACSYMYVCMCVCVCMYV